MSGSSVASGAAQGAATGASMGGGWGALAGAVIGGMAGANTPDAQKLGPPVAIGGSYNPYGYLTQDPYSGAVYQFGNEANFSPTELYNQAIMAQLMGAPATGAGSQEDLTYQDARANILAQMQQADRSIHGPMSLDAANATKDRLQAELAQLDAAHAQAGGAASSNPMLQYLNQGKYNNISDIINLNNNAAQLQAQQEMASRGLSGSSMADLNNRQMQLQRGVQLGSALQNVGQQDFNSRIAMLQALQGQNAAQQQSRLANAQMGLGYNQLGAGIGQNFADAAMGINSTNTGLANASNWAQYNANQQALSGLGSAIGAMSGGGSKGNGTNGSGGSSSSYSGGNLASNPTYNYGSSNPYNFNPNSGFSTNMTAAGG